MNYRHDVAQIAGLTAISFGQEDIDRYIVVYKKENAPSEDEIFARRNGEEWNAVTAQKYAQMVKFNWQLFSCIHFQFFIFIDFQRFDEKQKAELNDVKTVEVKPNSNYKDKYAHLIGQDAAVEAAKKTESNKSYGFGRTWWFQIRN